MLPTLVASVLVFMCVLTGNGFTSADCPPIIARSTWGASPPTYQQKPLHHPIKRVFIHDINHKPCRSSITCAAALRDIQDEHTHKRVGRRVNQTFSDIVFNFVIGGDGQIYEGRGWDKRGLHAGNYSDSLSIALIGSFFSRLPSPRMERAVENLIKCGVSTGTIARTYRLHGHRDAVPKSYCPGLMLYNELKKYGTNFGGVLPDAQ